MKYKLENLPDVLFEEIATIPSSLKKLSKGLQQYKFFKEEEKFDKELPYLLKYPDTLMKLNIYPNFQL